MYCNRIVFWLNHSSKSMPAPLWARGERKTTFGYNVARTPSIYVLVYIPVTQLLVPLITGWQNKSAFYLVIALARHYVFEDNLSKNLDIHFSNLWSEIGTIFITISWTLPLKFPITHFYLIWHATIYNNTKVINAVIMKS